MSFLSSMNIVGSGLTAQQLRLDVIAENVTNANTTRTENGEGPYRRKVVVFQAETGRDSFRAAMARAAQGLAPNTGYATAGGVRVVNIAEDPEELKRRYRAVSSAVLRRWMDAVIGPHHDAMAAILNERETAAPKQNG